MNVIHTQKDCTNKEVRSLYTQIRLPNGTRKWLKVALMCMVCNGAVIDKNEYLAIQQEKESLKVTANVA